MQRRTTQSLDSKNDSSPTQQRYYKPPKRKFHFYYLFPWRSLSRFTGWITKLESPRWLIRCLIYIFVKYYKINLKECERENISEYKSIAHVFDREIKDSARVIDEDKELVSPCDGTIIQFTKIKPNSDEFGYKNSKIPKIKGTEFSIQEFMGLPDKDKHIFDNICPKVPTSPDKSLYCCVIYLSLQDHHKFFAPAKCTFTVRRHFPGDLLPSLTVWVDNVFNVNERVVYIGTWKHGFISMTPVGATNVGSIEVYKDKELQTDRVVIFNSVFGTPMDKWFMDGNELEYEKSERMGQFNFGSTIVLIFEAPAEYQEKFESKIGNKIKIGESLI